MAKSTNFIHALGRRKTSSARVRLYKGKEESQVNGIRAEEVFPGKFSKSLLFRPFEVTKTVGKYYFTAKVVGGGKNSQLEAVVLGIARALARENTDQFKPQLKPHDLLTRDPRERQRRMVGNAGKSRRKKSSPKR